MNIRCSENDAAQCKLRCVLVVCLFHKIGGHVALYPIMHVDSIHMLFLLQYYHLHAANLSSRNLFTLRMQVTLFEIAAGIA